MLDPVAILTVALAMAALFGGAAAAKLSDPSGFRAIVLNYRLLPASAVTLAAGLLIAVEGAVAVAWLIPGVRPLAACTSAVLLLGYGAAIAINLRRGRANVDCGCGFGTVQRLSWALVVRNGLLAAVAVSAALPALPRALSAADYGVAITASVAAIALYLAAQQLIGNGAALALQRSPEG